MGIAARSGTLLLVVAAVSAACDRTPTDPAQLDPAAALLAGTTESSVYASSPTSLHNLFGVAVSRIAQKQGPQGIIRLLGNWQRLNTEARDALKSGDRQSAQNKVAAVRAEEIRTVLRMLGPGTASRVTTDVAVGLAKVRLDLASMESSGIDVTRAKSSSMQVSDLLQKANAALEDRDDATALDQATQASDLLDGVLHVMIALHRIPALETLFTEATAKYEREHSAEALKVMLAPFDKENQQAHAALRAGDRVVAGEKLESARREQIHVVLTVLGPESVGSLLQKVDAGIDSTRTHIARIGDPTVAERARKMLSEAQSLNARAREAWRAKEPANALDLASHSAGLVNALQHLTPATRY
jgi:hypothetical protein